MATAEEKDSISSLPFSDGRRKNDQRGIEETIFFPPSRFTMVMIRFCVNSF